MLITDPRALEKFASAQRMWQGIPGVALSPKGKIFACFYSGGVTEQMGNFCVLVESRDGGISFSEPIAAVYAGEKARCYDPALWVDPLGRLWFFFALSPAFEEWACVCEDPDADMLSWSAPRKIGQDVMMNKPIVKKDGAWLLPIAVWREGIQVITGTIHACGLSYVYESRDQGKTFQRIGGADVPKRGFDEHMVVEMKDGSLTMLVRTLYGIGLSHSFDGGHTWTLGEPSGIPGPSSRFHLRRLPSGRILLINHVQFTGRDHLAALLSEDEMQSWKGCLMLDERKDVSYPDADVDAAGNIYIVYDRERGAHYLPDVDYTHSAREILLAKITEKDILAGKIVTPGSYLRAVISGLGDRR